MKSWSNGLENDYGRFEFGRPPEKNGDYAFLLHILKSLKSTGKAAVILPHGVLFRGNAEATIRRELLKRGYIKGIIGLPANLFYGTGIPACIVVLDKQNAQSRTGVFMIDASKGFAKDGPKNRLRAQDMHKIVDVFTRQLEVPRYSRMVPLSEIANPANDYNLNIPRYIDSSEPEDIQDLHAHLHGGIPNRDLDALSPYWDAFPTLRSTLFKPNRPGYSDLAIEIDQVQQAILDSEEFKAFAHNVQGRLGAWFTRFRPSLEAIDRNTKPSQLIAELGENLLLRFTQVPLLDEYDVYEQLMTYWQSTMSDDVALIMGDGWLNAARPRQTIDDKERKFSETPDLVIGAGRSAQKYKTDLIPPSLIVARHFAAQQAQVDEFNAKAEDATRAIEEYVEEHAVEEGSLSYAIEDDKVTKATVTARLRDTKAEHAEAEETKALQHAIALYNAEASAKKVAKDSEAAVDLAALKQYGALTVNDVRQLVLDDKWKAAVIERVETELDSLTLALVARIQQLGERYDQTLGDLEQEFARIDSLVKTGLAELGVL